MRSHWSPHSQLHCCWLNLFAIFAVCFTSYTYTLLTPTAYVPGNTQKHHHHKQQPIDRKRSDWLKNSQGPLPQHQQSTQRVGDMTLDSSSLNNGCDVNNNGDSRDDKKQTINIAFIGNSFLYYNDCPRLLQRMLQERFEKVSQNSCLRGGATLISLLQKGNGMAKKFSSRPDVSKCKDGSFDIGAPTVEELLSERKWDFVIMNDHSQSPARTETKQETIKVLNETYIPLIYNKIDDQIKQSDNNTDASSSSSPVIVFLQTPAYRKPVKDSDELGTYDDFTNLLSKGYQEYVQLFSPHVAKVAPVGIAFQDIKHQCDNMNNNNTNDQIQKQECQEHNMWQRLYYIDDFHPSPYGTLLQASVLFCTIVGEAPPVYDSTWWEKARYMQPPETDPLPLPTDDEAQFLQDVACQICGIHKKKYQDTNSDNASSRL